MKIFGIESGKLAKWLLMVFAVSTLLSCLALWAAGLPSAIRNGEDWPRIHREAGTR